MIFMINILLFGLLKFKKGKKLTKELLVLLAHIKPWSMSDIFFISILVALVKLIGYAQIHLGISFFALILFIILDVYVSKKIHISEIWILRKKIFLDKSRYS
jgi:paraquat-inducible protein A